MSLELLTAETLLGMAMGGIVGNASSDGARLLLKQLWQAIKTRLVKNQPIEIIVELEQNPSQENLRRLEAFLQVEMYKDNSFAEELSRLGNKIAQTNRKDSGDNISAREIKAEGKGVAAAKINAPNSRIGGSDTNINVGKD